MIATVPRSLLKPSRRRQTEQPFLFGPLRETDWAIDALPVGNNYLLFLDRNVARDLYGPSDGTDEIHNCTGAVVAALEDLMPLEFERYGESVEGWCGIVANPDGGDSVAVFGQDALTCLSWLLRHQRTGFYLRLFRD